MSFPKPSPKKFVKPKILRQSSSVDLKCQEDLPGDLPSPPQRDEDPWLLQQVLQNVSQRLEALEQLLLGDDQWDSQRSEDSDQSE